MKKVLIEAATVDQYISRQENRLYLDPTRMILTPGARDELLRRKVEIVPGSRPAAACNNPAPGACPLPAAAYCPDCSAGAPCPACAPQDQVRNVERLLRAVADILRRDYGVTDPTRLKALSEEAVKIIWKNL